VRPSNGSAKRLRSFERLDRAAVDLDGGQRLRLDRRGTSSRAKAFSATNRSSTGT
jgi:hypothetical protein